MLRTYKAKLNNNIIKWVDEKPEDISNNETFFVHVTIVDKEKLMNSFSKENLVDFFKNSPLYGMELDIERDKDYGREVEL
jgi:hypothetical protein